MASSVGAIAAAYPPLPARERVATGGMRANRLAGVYCRPGASPGRPAGTGPAIARSTGRPRSGSGLATRVCRQHFPCRTAGAGGGGALDTRARHRRRSGAGVPLDHDLLEPRLPPGEIARLGHRPAPLHQAKLIFSAKESVYKCLAPADRGLPRLRRPGNRARPRRRTVPRPRARSGRP